MNLIHAERTDAPIAQRAERGTCRLTLQINGATYRIRPAPSPAPFASVRAFRLRECGGTDSYTVARTLTGDTCDCPAYRATKPDGPADCEHIRALIAVGLIDRDSLRDRPGLAPGGSLADRADREADAYRALGTPEGDLFARTMAELAANIRMTRATSPDEYEDRIEVLEDGLRERREAERPDGESQHACRCRIEPLR